MEETNTKLLANVDGIGRATTGFLPQYETQKDESTDAWRVCWNKCIKSCKKCKRCPKITSNYLSPKIATLIIVISRYVALFDTALDLRLLYKSTQSRYLFLTVSLFLSIVAPYLLQYSCGIKLFTLRRTFEQFSGFTSIFVILYLLPTGVLYFIFLDLFDILFTVHALLQLICFNKSTEELKMIESLLAHQLGMSRTNWEGLKRQRGVSQLMFETIPQVIVQGLLYFSIISGLELTNISQNDVLYSIASALFSSFAQIVKLVFEAHAVQESFFQYSLTCFMARIGWVPFRPKIRKILEGQKIQKKYNCCGCKCLRIQSATELEEYIDTSSKVNPILSQKRKVIDYDIKYEIPLTRCIYRAYGQVEYYFSENTIKDLMATLMLRKEVDDDDYKRYRLEIKFHESLQLLSVARLVDLLRICSERLIIIRGLNNPNYLDWEKALNISRNLKEDTTTLKYSRDLAGKPHLMSIYLSEYRLKEFAKKVYSPPTLTDEWEETQKEAQLIASWEAIRSKNMYKNKEYDFVKKIKIDVGSDTSEVRSVAFNIYDDPAQIAREFGQKYIQQFEDDMNKAKMIDDIASQVIPIVMETDRIQYVLSKLKVLFRIRRLRMAEEELKIQEENAFVGDIFTAATDNTPYMMEYHVLLNELRKDGFMAESKSEKEEEALLRTVRYLHDIGEIHLEYNEEAQKGYIYEHISIYEQCIKLDFDINATDISSGESLIFTLIRKNDASNVRLLLFEYQIEKKIQIHIDIHNFKGKSPLYYALRGYIESMYNCNGNNINKLYLLLLKANADPNFPCTKRAQIAKSPLNYLLSQFHGHSHAYANSQQNALYWEMINDLIYYGAVLYHHETFIVPKLMIPMHIDAKFKVRLWKRHWLDKLIQVCNKLKLSMNTVEDENGNNPIHLLLKQYYHVIKQKSKAQDIEESIKYLFKIFKKDLSWNATDNIPYHSQKKSQIDASKQDLSVHSTLTLYFDQIANDIEQYIGDLQSANNTQDDEKVSIEYSVVKKKTRIAQIMMKLQRINWKWMQSTNADDNLPITAVLREDDIPIQLLKDAFAALDTRVKQKAFIDSIKANRYAIAIICNYIVFQVCKAKNIRLGTLKKWQAIDIKDKLSDHLKQKIEAQKMEEDKQKTIPQQYEAEEIVDLTKSLQINYLHEDDETEISTTHKSINKFEITYSAIVESLSVADLVTDFIVLQDLIATNNQWWTAFILLFILAPYLVSFCSLGSIFQSTEKDIANVLCLLLITPFSLFLLILLDMTFMVFVVLNLFGLIICFWNENLREYLIHDKIFLNFGVTHMQIKGYRRLRTLSQLAFETIPQTLIQLRIYQQIQIEGQTSIIDALEVSEEALVLSILIAIIHFSLELTILWIESKAARTTPFQYGIICLNARLNWVPLLNIIFKKHEAINIAGNIKMMKDTFSATNTDIKNEIDWENLDHKLCGMSYHLDFDFCQGSFKRLYTQITRIPRFTDSNEVDVKPLVTMLPIQYIQDVVLVYLGDASCRFVELRDLSRLYRNSDNRIILDGTRIDWTKKVRNQKSDIAIVIDTKSAVLLMPEVVRKMKKFEGDDKFELDESVFGDFMQHGEVEALYAIWNAIKLQKERPKINIYKLKQDSLLNDITDVRTMKRFWEYNYMFGNSCAECHIIYDRIANYYDAILTLVKRNKSEMVDELIKHGNMILLILFFTRSAIINHKCPECNISWKKYIIDKLRSDGITDENPYKLDVTAQLPKYIKVVFVRESKESEEEKHENISLNIIEFRVPFILAECSDVLSEALGKEIMKNNRKIHEPIFSRKIFHKSAWEYIDNDGIKKCYDEKTQESINKQFDKLYKYWRIKRKKCKREQSPMKYSDNILIIELPKDKYQGEQIIIDYNAVPPKCIQVSTRNQFEKIVKQLKVKSNINDDKIEPMDEELIIEVNECINHSKMKQIVHKVNTQQISEQECIYILSSIIEYEADSKQSLVIIKHHYDAKKSGKPSHFDKILTIAKKLKLRHGYDKLLMALQRFYQKKTIDIITNSTLTSNITVNVSSAEIGAHVLGIKQVKVNVTVSATLDSEYQMKDFPDTVGCQLWLKIPINKKKKQIDSWNDILLKKIRIDLSECEHKDEATQIYTYKRGINVNLSENYTSLGSWNPSLYYTDINDTKQIEFIVKLEEMDEDENIAYNYEALIESAQVTVITETEEIKRNINYNIRQFYDEYQAFEWKWEDNNKSKKLQPYDRDANKQIERDYQRLRSMADRTNQLKTLIIPITDGMWANEPRNKNKYEIRIIRTDTHYCYYQVNVKTGSTRFVKRENVVMNERQITVQRTLLTLIAEDTTEQQSDDLYGVDTNEDKEEEEPENETLKQKQIHVIATDKSDAVLTTKKKESSMDENAENESVAIEQRNDAIVNEADFVDAFVVFRRLYS